MKRDIHQPLLPDSRRVGSPQAALLAAGLGGVLVHQLVPRAGRSSSRRGDSACHRSFERGGDTWEGGGVLLVCSCCYRGGSARSQIFAEGGVMRGEGRGGGTTVVLVYLSLTPLGPNRQSAYRQRLILWQGKPTG